MALQVNHNTEFILPCSDYYCIGNTITVQQYPTITSLSNASHHFLYNQMEDFHFL